MTEKVTNELIFSVLQSIQSDVSDLKFDVRDLKIRMTSLKNIWAIRLSAYLE